ncbi:MAG: hypothetical protein Q9214_001461 [Letrouitia sp. 1 TL-2023]
MVPEKMQKTLRDIMSRTILIQDHMQQTVGLYGLDLQIDESLRLCKVLIMKLRTSVPAQTNCRLFQGKPTLSRYLGPPCAPRPVTSPLIFPTLRPHFSFMRLSETSTPTV